MASNTQGLHGPGDRWAAALRSAYPGPFQAKRIAGAFGVEVRTAEGWLTGRTPQIKHLMKGWMLHGGGFVAAVLAPTPPAVDHEVRRLKRAGVALDTRLAGLERERVQAKAQS